MIRPYRAPKVKNRRAQLLGIACELAAERGPRGYRLENVAARAGCAVSTVSGYVGGLGSLRAKVAEIQRAAVAEVLDAEDRP